MVGKIKSLTTLSNAVVVLKLKSLVNTSVHFKDLLGVEVFMELNRILSVSRNLKINQLQLKKDSRQLLSEKGRATLLSEKLAIMYLFQLLIKILFFKTTCCWC